MDDLKERIARVLDRALAFEVESDVRAHELTHEERLKIAQAVLTELSAGDGVQECDREAAQALCASGWTHAIDAFARHRTLAAAAERARIVAGVRACELSSAIPDDPAQIISDLADAIEAGEQP